jgi:hypothetical protein
MKTMNKHKLVQPPNAGDTEENLSLEEKVIDFIYCYQMVVAYML